MRFKKMALHCVRVNINAEKSSAGKNRAQKASFAAFAIVFAFRRFLLPRGNCIINAYNKLIQRII